MPEAGKNRRLASDPTTRILPYAARSPESPGWVQKADLQADRVLDHSVDEASLTDGAAACLVVEAGLRSRHAALGDVGEMSALPPEAVALEIGRAHV